MSDKNHNVQVLSGTVVIATSETTTAGTNSYTFLNGQATHVTFTTPNMEATDSTKLQVVLVSSPNGTVFDSGTKAESSAFSIGSQFPLAETVRVVATAEGTQSANKSIPFSIYYQT